MQGFLSFLLLSLALMLPGRAVAVDVEPAGGSELASVPVQPLRIPHIALLLPLKSGTFGRAAEAVKQGFMAAAKAQSGALAVKVYPSSDQADDIVAVYAQATQAGAQLVVGPLTRNGVTALAASQEISVPTLALNFPERELALPPGLYLLGLAADLEARQIAQLASTGDRKSATVIVSASALPKRMQTAFEDEWSQLGGEIVSRHTFSVAQAAGIRDAIQKKLPDMIFLALDSQDARLVRPYLNSDIPTYATSQIYAGKENPQKYHDLNGVQFVDMPWMLQADHAAVMIYPRPQMALGADRERLYALGIDAWRLAGMLLTRVQGSAGMTLDGVTGRLDLDGMRQFRRRGVLAEFRDGEAVSVGAP